MTRDGIEHRAAAVSFVTGLSTLTAIGFQLITVPICLHYWGREMYGSWLSIYAAFMLVRTLDTGFVTYVGNKLASLYHQDQAALREHLSSAVAGIALLGLLQLAVSISAICSDGIARVLGVSALAASGLRSDLALLVLIVSWVLSGSYLGFVQRLLIPTGLMYQAAWWSMALQVSQFSGIILSALLGFDLLETSLVFALVQLFTYAASAVYIRRKLPAYFPWWTGWRFTTGMKDLARSLWLTASNLVQQGTVSGAVMLVSVLSSPAMVPVFTTVRTLANLWNTVSNLLTQPLFPDIVRYHATHDGHKLVEVCKAHWVLISTVINLGILATFPLIEPLYGYWTTHAVPLDMTLLCLLLGSIVVVNVGGLIALYLAGINSLRVVLAASVWRGILSLGAGGYLYSRFGFAGFGAGILAGECVANLLMGYYFVRVELPRQGAHLSMRSLAPVVLSTVLVLAFLLIQATVRTYAVYVYPVAVLGVVTAAIWGWHGLQQNVRNRLRNMVIGRLTRKDVA